MGLKIIRSICGILKNITNAVMSRINAWRERRRYIIGLCDQQIEYRPDKVDVALARECKEYLWEMFPNGIGAKVEQMTDEEILALFHQIIKDAESIMGLKLDNIDLYTSAEWPLGYYCGYYNHQDNSLHINAAFLLSGNVSLIEEQVYTIFHELKHARQWAAVVGDIDFGYSQETLQQWAESFQMYIPSSENDEAYRKQAVELDAYGFETILKGERQFETLQ